MTAHGIWSRLPKYLFVDLMLKKILEKDQINIAETGVRFIKKYGMPKAIACFMQPKRLVADPARVPFDRVARLEKMEDLW